MVLICEASKNDDRERDSDAYVNPHAFCHCRCAAGRNANRRRAIAVFISLVRARWHQGLKCLVLLLHELGAVQDNNVGHRRHLRREPVLPCATQTAAAPFVGEATPSPARLRGLRALAANAFLLRGGLLELNATLLLD